MKSGGMSSSVPCQSTVILAFRSDVVADVYGLAFEGVFGSRVIACGDAKEAASALRKNPAACVVIESAIPGGPLNAFFEMQASLAKRANVFVLGGGKDLLPETAENLKVRFLAERPEMKEVVSEVEMALRLSNNVQEYCRISLKSLLVRSARLRCDVYLQLSDQKFVKVLHANDKFDDADYERFKAKKIEFLYLPRADFLGLMEDLLNKASELNRAPEKITLDGAVNANQAIFQIVHSAFETDGFTPQLQRLTQASVTLAINTIRKNPKISDLFARFDANRESYLTWHSTALSFLCCKLATMLGWHSEATFYKLSLAAVLHDMVLPTDALARIQTVAELQASNISEKDRARVLRHPLEGAQLVSSIDEIPGEVGFIIEQHHERQDGSGFPRGIDHKDISSISALFIIAHDIVTTMFDAPPEKFEMQAFLAAREAEKSYTKGAFGQVYRALMTKVSEI
jgi:HD-GYP domain-containing protein (c-di-GMP phosphodiesterase class II)